LIAFLFAQVVNSWWMAKFVFNKAAFSSKSAWFFMTGLLLVTWLVFVLHFVFLAGMFKLRRLIYQNTINTWYQQFDQKP
jgi:hypothetical protein